MDRKQLLWLALDRSVFEYGVVVDCEDEAHQTELLARFEAEGLKAHAVIG
jgi:hypothetical protein